MNFKWPFFVTLPHSGESVPDEVVWLKNIPATTLMRDVDRFVDQLYHPTIDLAQIPFVKTQWHRYVVDLNRKTTDFDQSAVVGAKENVGRFPKGLHWTVTTQGEPLILKPMTQELHELLLKKYYQPFHDSVQDMRKKMKLDHPEVYHMDLHSMPSLGTEMHPDPGQERADIVISDFHGASCSSVFKEIVVEAYVQAGFQVAYNWPYVGGGITQLYGQPKLGFNTIQVELNRKLYMDEVTQLKNQAFLKVQEQLKNALLTVVEKIKVLSK